MSTYLFSGLKVIDAATVIAAPAAAMMLADFGADVIKIEPPNGDMLRIIKDVPETPESADDYMWQMDGHGKRGITLDLKQPEGIEILRKLVSECDVFITNQPYSVRESLGMTYEVLRPLRPNMIYASLTAYGENGPDRATKGFDQLAYWARSGLMDLMRGDDNPPIQGLSGMGDHPTGVAIYAGIVTALLHREKTGEGGMVHTSLLANGLWSCSAIAQGVLAGGNGTQFRENRKSMPAMFRVYQCADDRWLQLNMVRNEELLSLFLAAIEASELFSDDRFNSMMRIHENRVPFGDEIAKILLQKDSNTWLDIFSNYDLPIYRIATVDEKVSDIQVLSNNMAIEPSDPEMGVNLLLKHPIQITSVPQVEAKRPPKPGEHGEEILREIGYTREQIEQLQEDGII